MTGSQAAVPFLPRDQREVPRGNDVLLVEGSHRGGSPKRRGGWMTTSTIWLTKYGVKHAGVKHGTRSD